MWSPEQREAATSTASPRAWLWLEDCHLEEFIRSSFGGGCREKQHLDTQSYHNPYSLQPGPKPTCTLPRAKHLLRTQTRTMRLSRHWWDLFMIATDMAGLSPLLYTYSLPLLLCCHHCPRAQLLVSTARAQGKNCTEGQGNRYSLPHPGPAGTEDLRRLKRLQICG